MMKKDDFTKGVYHGLRRVKRGPFEDQMKEWLEEMREDGKIDWYILGNYVGYIHNHGHISVDGRKL